MELFENAVVLPYPDFTNHLILDTGASDTGIGAVLSLIDTSTKERPIAFYSRTLSKAERRYSVMRKELLALVVAVQHYRVYLYGRNFVALPWNLPLLLIVPTTSPKKLWS